MMYQYEEDMNKIYDLMRVHNDWMRDSVNLIASENTTSNAVTTAMASDLAHRYAEGQAYERLYQGCTYIDQIEDITKQLSCKVKTLQNNYHVKFMTVAMQMFNRFPV